MMLYFAALYVAGGNLNIPPLKELLALLQPNTEHFLTFGIAEGMCRLTVAITIEMDCLFLRLLRLPEVASSKTLFVRLH